MSSLISLWDLLKTIKPVIRETGDLIFDELIDQFRRLKQDYLNEWLPDIFDQVTDTYTWLNLPINTLLDRTSKKFPEFSKALQDLVDEIPKLPEKLAALKKDVLADTKTVFTDFRDEYFDIWFPNLFEQITNVHTWLSPEIATIKTKVKEGFPNLQKTFVNSLKEQETTISQALREVFADLKKPTAEGGKSIFAELLEAILGFKGSLDKIEKPTRVDQNPELVADLIPLIEQFETESGFLDFSGLLRLSFTDPDAARERAKSSRQAIVAAALGLGAAGVAVELATLGQVEGVTDLAMNMMETLGWLPVARELGMMEYQAALLTPYQYWLNKEYTPTIPGPSDLVNFLVRETMTRARFDELMSFQGFQQEFTDAYWNAHWRLPSVNQVYEMFQREVAMPIVKLNPDGTTSITIADTPELRLEAMREYLKLADYFDEWRDPLIAISYNPITRVDLRRLYQGGELDEAGMAKRLEFTGLSPPDAVLVARAQVLQARGEELGLTLTNLKQDRVEGWLTALEYEASLDSLELPPNELAFRVADTEHDRDRDNRKDRLGLYQDGFRKDLIDVTQYTQFLLTEGLEQENIDLIIGEEQIRKGVNIFEEVP